MAQNNQYLKVIRRSVEAILGKKVKSWACKIVEHDKPTLENWKDYFVGFDSETKLFVHEVLQPTRPKLNSLQPVELTALPSAEDFPVVHGIDF